MDHCTHQKGMPCLDLARRQYLLNQRQASLHISHALSSGKGCFADISLCSTVPFMLPIVWKQLGNDTVGVTQ